METTTTVLNTLNNKELMTLGSWVKRCREQKGLTLKELRDKVGCAYTTLQSIENQYPIHKGGKPYQPANKLMQAILDELELHITLKDLERITDWKSRGNKKHGTFGHNSIRTKFAQRKKKDPSEFYTCTEQKYMKKGITDLQTLKQELQTLKADLEMYKKIDVQQLNEENIALKNYIRSLLRKDLNSLIEDQIDTIAKGGEKSIT